MKNERHKKKKLNKHHDWKRKKKCIIITRRQLKKNFKFISKKHVGQTTVFTHPTREHSRCIR